MLCGRRVASAAKVFLTEIAGECVQPNKLKAMKHTIATPIRFVAGAALLLALTFTAPHARAADTQTVKGEVVDLMCYLDHGAKGEKHADCAKMCIESGGPVGLLTADNKLYLLVGEHKPMNDKLASLAAKTITVKGKIVERNGMKMIENAEIVKG